ncbi:hypothetical protein F5Y05DRAFT_337695 [Hypoxylon sp. FL0543]|nr:hypothetical protein F5Y05DRAFT_337695 [Hypoxylon sp. FL0543]
MKATLLLSYLPTIILVGTKGSNAGAVLPRSDADTIASFGRQGLCLSYFSTGPTDKELAPCKIFCPTQDPNQDPNGVGCKGPGIDQDKLDPSTIFKDDDGNEYTPGTCVCDLSAAEAFLDVVIQALAKLDEVLCAVILSAITTIIEIGIDFVPGGAETEAVKKAVEGAKTFVENGLDAASFFGNWIGDSCGISDFSFNLQDAFDGLSVEPDSLGVSKGCFKSGGACPKP